MLKFFRSLVLPASNDAAAVADTPLPSPTARIEAPGAATLDLSALLVVVSGLPTLDWTAVHVWVDSIAGEADRKEAWARCERAWLEHLGVALGPGYHLRSQGTALLLSTLPDKLADTTLAYVNKTVQRIVRVLDGIALAPDWGHEILIVFDDPDSYYRYVSCHYPEDGEFAASSGMYLDHGCGHFVTVEADLRAVEPVIAHELTHLCLSHLPIPAWLNEGLAVNTELRLCATSQPAHHSSQVHARHLKFWTPETIQGFWSGQSFLRSDEGSELSYDLARVLVSQFAADWEPFRRFVLSAHLGDAASTAARGCLGIGLGAAVCAMLEREPDPAWEPSPDRWPGDPARGAFAQPSTR